VFLMTGCKLLALILAGACCAGLARAAEGKEHGFLDRVHRDASGNESKYVLFVPYGYRGDKPYPLILFLHGLGECGTDGHKQAAVGLGPAVRRRAKTFGFITIFPQAQHRTWQADSEDARRALAILAEVEKEYRVDPRRVYLTGLSMGGYGTWSLAAKYPDRWAAIAPVCGGGNPANAARIKDLPCWCFHGAADRTVPASNSRQMVEALRAAGGHPRYTEYPGVGHNSWDRAYGTDELYDWLSQHHRK
jgi:predicted peptidase